MSASKEKKNRQEQTGSGWADPKTAREAQQRKEERRSNILYGVIAVLFVAAAVVTMVWKSGVVQRNAAAATVNGEKYTAAEVQYYYSTILNNYSNYLSYMGVDTSKSLRDQKCDVEGSDTWFDYFAKQALEQMSAVHSLCAKADADNFTWNDDMQATFDQNMQTLQEQVDSYNGVHASRLKIKDYLKLLYGSVMSQSVYEEQVKLTIQAQAYISHYSDSLTYSDSDLEAAYSKNQNTYDRVDYQSIKIDGSAASTKDADGKTVEPTDDDKAAALKSAKELADSIYASFRGGRSLEDLAGDEDKASYTDGANATYSDSVLMNWLFDKSRKEGDSAVLSDEDNSAYYVVSFGRRFRPDSDTVDVRHILIQPESGSKKEGDDGYDDEQKELKAAAKTKAEDLLAQFQAGDATEDAFAALARENSDDTGSASNGGLISQVSEYSNYVEPFKNWCLESHQPGDTGIVESDYGYHIMYFVGSDGPYWKVQVTAALKNDATNTWYEEATKDGTSETASGIRYVG